MEQEVPSSRVKVRFVRTSFFKALALNYKYNTMGWNFPVVRSSLWRGPPHMKYTVRDNKRLTTDRWWPPVITSVSSSSCCKCRALSWMVVVGCDTVTLPTSRFICLAFSAALPCRHSTDNTPLLPSSHSVRAAPNGGACILGTKKLRQKKRVPQLLQSRARWRSTLSINRPPHI